MQRGFYHGLLAIMALTHPLGRIQMGYPRLSLVLGIGAVVVAFVLVASVPAAGQAPAAGVAPASAANDWSAPRTPWGHPDLQGIWTTDDEISVPVERPETLSGRSELTEEETASRTAQREAGLERGSGQTGDGPPHWYETAAQASTRASFVVDPADGRIPYTDAGRREWDNRNMGSFKEEPFDGPEDLDLRDRCITRGLPNTYFPSAYNNGFQIIQHPDHVAILYERLHEHRLIPIDGRQHLDASVRQWFGDSRGRWEGDTLVVETTNYTDQVNFRGSREGLRLVERFTRTGPGSIQVEFTASDPEAWTSDWTVVVHGRGDPTYWQIFEYACHEANYGMFNMLSGARALEAKAAAESGSK